MATASNIASVSKSRATVAGRVGMILREIRKSFERHSELQVLLSAGYGHALSRAHKPANHRI